jgi:hypothetical protein
MKQRGILWVLVVPATLTLAFAFQNCSKVNFTLDNAAVGGMSANDNGGHSSGEDAAVAIKTLKPVFAVRAMNCVACHGSFGASIVTDFGYGGANFSVNGNPFLPSSIKAAARSAYNNVDSGGGIGGWQSMTVQGGSIHIPKVSFSAQDSANLFGLNSATTLAQVLQWNGGINAGGRAMVDGVTPAAGQPRVVEMSKIVIGYPSEAEILSLAPALQAQAVGVTTIQPSGKPAPQMAGFVADASGKFIRNSGNVTCYGDVVVKGPLFLKNLNLVTDSNGCRLYVSQSVFIQGPVTYVNGGASNLQITSPRAITMGLSAERMGAASSGGSVRMYDTNLTTAGGPWARFTVSLDAAYNPSGGAINGVPTAQYFDNIVSDAKLIGGELLDVADRAYTDNPIAGRESVIYEDPSGENGGLGVNRISLNYEGLLLNAPHIHSRYFGDFKGVIIAEVAMLARNPSSKVFEQFLYDPKFDSIPVGSILPALSTPIFDVK